MSGRNSIPCPRARSKRVGNKIEIFVGRRFAGKVIYGDTFSKTVNGSEHFLRSPLAIAISVSALNMAKHHGARQLEVIDQETGLAYYADVVHFERYAFEIQRGGFELQKALPLNYWDVDTVTWFEMDGERFSFDQKPASHEDNPVSQVVQLSLFA